MRLPAVLLVACAVLLAVTPAVAGMKQARDPKGAFVVDVPDHWQVGQDGGSFEAADPQSGVVLVVACEPKRAADLQQMAALVTNEIRKEAPDWAEAARDRAQVAGVEALHFRGTGRREGKEMQADCYLFLTPQHQFAIFLICPRAVANQHEATFRSVIASFRVAPGGPAPQTQTLPGPFQPPPQTPQPQPGTQPGFPQPGTQPGFPQPGTQPGFPQPGTQPGFPQPGTQPGFPQPGTQPGFPQPGTQPGFPQPGTQPPFPQPPGTQPGFPQPGTQPGTQFPLQPSSIGMIRYADPTGLFAISYPGGWRIFPFNAPGRFKTTEPRTGLIVVEVTAALRTAQSVAEFAQQALAAAQVQLPNFTVQGTQDIQLCGRPAVVARATSLLLATPMVAQIVFLITDRYQYVAWAACPLDWFQQQEGVFNQILGSLQVP